MLSNCPAPFGLCLFTSSKVFTYTNTNTGFGVLPETANVVGILTTKRENGDRPNLPMLERNEYDTTYTIQEVDTIQDYISGQQDGVYI